MNIVLQVLPLATTEHPGADGSLTILEPAAGPPVAYAEGWRNERLVESAPDVADAVMTFDGPRLIFTPAEWEAFAASVRDGTFDLV